MPLIKLLSLEEVRIGIWLMEESSKELSTIVTLSEREHQQFQRFFAETRKREFLSVRVLLGLITGLPGEIFYNETGQPFLADSEQFLSISHSGNLAAIIFSDKVVGIDAEVTGRKISNIASRFLSPEELQWTLQSGDPSLAQLYCWCCKESIYKMLGLKNLIFKKDILVAPVELKPEGEGGAFIRNEQIQMKIRIHYFTLANNMVTWCTLEEALNGARQSHVK
jgi:4'-phosphopantetheinyl transferase